MPRRTSIATSIALAAWFLAGVLTPSETRAQSCPELSGPVHDLADDTMSGGACLPHDAAQTFTVTQAGRIIAVEIRGGRQSAVGLPTNIVSADLRPVFAGIPVEANSAALASLEIRESDLPLTPAWIRLEFGDQGPIVQPGQTLALVFRVNGNFCINWRGVSRRAPDDPYPAGGHFTRGESSPTWFTTDGVPQGFLVTFGDYNFRVITCEAVVPAAPTTWGRLKTRYD